MNNEENFKLQLGTISERLKAVSDEFIGKVVVTAVALEELKQQVLLALVPAPDNDRLRFADGKQPDEIVPANLYTVLRLYLGSSSPSWEDCKDGFWKMDNGTEFSFIDGEARVYVPTALNLVEVTIQVSHKEVPKSYAAGSTYLVEDRTNPQLGDLVVRSDTGEIHWVVDDCSRPALIAAEYHAALNNYGCELRRPSSLLPSDGELFYCSNGKGAFVRKEPGSCIDWDKAMKAWASLAGKSNDVFFSTGLYHNDWINGVPYVWGLAGSAGAQFCVYQLPGVPDYAVTQCCHELKCNRDVVGRIQKVSIEQMLDFNCPKK